MMSYRYFNENMSAFAPCANAAFSCAQSYSANAAVIILDAILASIFVMSLIAVLGLISLLGILLVLCILVLAGRLVIRKLHTPWWTEPNSLPV